MNKDLQEEVLDEIRTFVAAGIFDQADILWEIGNMFMDERLNKRWIKRQIAGSYQQQLLLQAFWPPVTDVDRLTTVFEYLDHSGILALHRAGDSLSDSIDAIHLRHKELAARGIKKIGYCFYHSQDMWRLVEGGKDLYLAFGDFTGHDQKGLEVGALIVKALQDQGFQIEWDRTLDNRIIIDPFHWQKRLP